ncbi:hypothetical protein GCM10010216_68700 [Streptomyces flaveolus]|nr:hypothetical protein GCM10010216_68700 [Streptomyces flaveolus]
MRQGVAGTWSGGPQHARQHGRQLRPPRSTLGTGARLSLESGRSRIRLSARPANTRTGVAGTAARPGPLPGRRQGARPVRRGGEGSQASWRWKVATSK